MRPNKNISFCPVGIVDGASQPFVVGLGAKHSYLATTSSTPSRTHGCSTVDCTRDPTLPRNSDFTPSLGPSSINWLRYQGYSGYSPSLLRCTPHREQHMQQHSRVLRPRRTSLSGSGPTEPPFTEALRLPSLSPSPQRPRIRSAKPTPRTLSKSPSILRSWTRSFGTTRSS